MVVTSVAQAMAVLADEREKAGVRETAVRYLAEHPTPTVITRLVQTLQDDDVGVRWETANVLAQLGEPALLEVLKALTDPKRVDDPHLRESAYHILHINQAAVPVPTADLLDALRGQVADISSLVEADRVLRAWAKHQSVKARAAGKPGTTDAAQTNLLNPQYGSARLTGRLGRLRGH
jgi:HEAT repeat protein